MNLGWKLAATIKGWAPKELLDTYTAERHPIGEWVLNWTRAQVAIIKTDPHARAMAAVIRDLIATKDGTNYFVEKISGVAMQYDLGGASAQGAERSGFRTRRRNAFGRSAAGRPRPVAQLQ
jgi:2-polyprenyl-6-methoxyphenol hydroxylase-like FAD-dependent oxidoreductase